MPSTFDHASLVNTNDSHYSALIMIVCLCHRVTDRDIAREVRNGCASFDELQDSLRVATACGSCREASRELFDEHAAPCPVGRRLDACPGHCGAPVGLAA